MLFLIYLLSFAVSQNDASLSSCKLLQDPIEMLKCEVEVLLKRSNHLELSLEEMETANRFQNKQLELLVKEGETSDVVQNQILRKVSKITAGLSSRCNSHACGPCACYTDYQLSKKYYCNCEHLEPMRDCLEFRDSGFNISGLYNVHMNNYKTVEVFCDQEADGGGWTVFQRRLNGETNFYRDWMSYKEGFGNPQREFWLGNDDIYLLTYQAEYPAGSELRVDMEDWTHQQHYAKYETFSIDNEEQKYELHITGFSGDVGDSLGNHNGHMFSTYDADNDAYTTGDCADMYRGAWWYTSCHSSNLNGEYRWFGETVPYARGVIWRHYKDYYYSMKSTEMKVRRKS